MTIREYISKLQQAKVDLDVELQNAAREATKRAVEVAAQKTPENKLRGTNAATGGLRSHWAEDSVIEPVKTSEGYNTILWNKLQYASYVDEGHRVDRHFVPGLIINPNSGMLEYNPNGEGGIVVGTQTQYVPGIHMSDDGKAEYEKAVTQILAQRVKEVFE